MILRIVYRSLVSKFLRVTFPFWEWLGIHVIPSHFYQPVPDTRTLPKRLWEEHSKLIGIDVNEKTQLDLLSRFTKRFKHEYEQLPREKTSVPFQYYICNNMFQSVDAEILYCMIRNFKPRRVIEIGSGNSTYLAAQTLVRNSEDENGYLPELTAIDPFPNKTVQSGFHGLSRLIAKRVEEVPLSKFQELEENDILIIDSSHVIRTGGDVEYEYLEVLPRLKKGVIVSFHDIFLPAEYPEEWVQKWRLFWTEQYLLQAFLAFNSSFEVLWMGSYMHLTHPKEIEAAFGSYNKATTWPGSFWMRRIREGDI